MITEESIRKIALSFPETTEMPHFEKTSFRVEGKIFATLDKKNMTVTLKLSKVDQDVFTIFDSEIIYPMPNKWGNQGWTYVILKQVRKDMLVDALKAAYCVVAPKRLSDLI